MRGYGLPYDVIGGNHDLEARLLELQRSRRLGS